MKLKQWALCVLGWGALSAGACTNFFDEGAGDSAPSTQAKAADKAAMSAKASARPAAP